MSWEYCFVHFFFFLFLSSFFLGHEVDCVLHRLPSLEDLDLHTPTLFAIKPTQRRRLTHIVDRKRRVVVRPDIANHNNVTLRELRHVALFRKKVSGKAARTRNVSGTRIPVLCHDGGAIGAERVDAQRERRWGPNGAQRDIGTGVLHNDVTTACLLRVLDPGDHNASLGHDRATKLRHDLEPGLVEYFGDTLTEELRVMGKRGGVRFTVEIRRETTADVKRADLTFGDTLVERKIYHDTNPRDDLSQGAALRTRVNVEGVQPRVLVYRSNDIVATFHCNAELGRCRRRREGGDFPCSCLGVETKANTRVALVLPERFTDLDNTVELLPAVDVNNRLCLQRRDEILAGFAGGVEDAALFGEDTDAVRELTRRGRFSATAQIPHRLQDSFHRVCFQRKGVKCGRRERGFEVGDDLAQLVLVPNKDKRMVLRNNALLQGLGDGVRDPFGVVLRGGGHQGLHDMINKVQKL
eukprot:PhM_4_TR6721/c0_g1_i1/m.68582